MVDINTGLSQSKPRSRVKLPPRVTHFILIKPWKVYVAPAEVVMATQADYTGWLPVVAPSNEVAENIGIELYRSLKK